MDIQSSGHQIYCCDCVSGARQHIADNSVDLIITDPPYGIDGNQLHRHYHRHEMHVIPGYVEVPAGDYAAFTMEWIRQAVRVLKPGGSLYVLSGYTHLPEILIALRHSGLQEINHIIWKYNFGVYTRKKYISSHYHILYYFKPGAARTFNTYSRFGGRERSELGRSLNYTDREDVWVINRQYKPGRAKNKNELPDELLIKMMLYSSNEGDLICDFFLGGFSTARIAVGLNRRITGFEINKESYRHGMEALSGTESGSLLDQIHPGQSDAPARQGQTWSPEEARSLLERYSELYPVYRNKRRVIGILQDEFQRGYFSILNRLEQALKNGSSGTSVRKDQNRIR